MSTMVQRVKALVTNKDIPHLVEGKLRFGTIFQDGDYDLFMNRGVDVELISKKDPSTVCIVPWHAIACCIYAPKQAR